MRFVSSKDVEATTNEVVDHFADLGVSLKVTLLDDSEVLIEGEARSLEFLANYMLAYVNGDEHARNINPKGAGSVFFNNGSSHGLYFHVVPCRHGYGED